MKTKLFLIATLFITAIAFSQTTKKGYDHYVSSNQSSASKKMNKAELTDAMVKDANLRKRPARTGRNPQTGKAIKNNRLNKLKNRGLSNPYFVANELDGDMMLKAKNNGGVEFKNRGKAQDHNASRSNTTSSVADPNFNGKNNNKTKVLRKRPGRTKYKKTTGTIFTPPIPTKATDYNSSRSNKNSNG